MERIMKKTIGFILILCLLMVMPGCGDDTSIEDVVIDVTQTSVSVGDTISVKIILNNFNGVRSFAIRPEFDDESFSVVSARNLAGGVLTDKYNGIVSSIFDEDKKIDGDTVAEFVIKAKTPGKAKTIGFEVSVLGVDDVKIEVDQPDSILIDVGY
jgi:hypothetical protein